jgi:hypothetical protein
MVMEKDIKIIEIIVDGEKRIIEIPLTLDELKLEHYMKLSEVNRKQWDLELERDLEVIGAFLGLDRWDLEVIDIETFNEIIEDLRFLNEQPEDLDNRGLKDYIEIDGEKWWIKKDFEKMTLGEKISVETLVKQNGGDYEGILDKLLTLFLKKRMNDGELETFRTSHLERADIFRKGVKFLDVRNILVFFSDVRSGSENNMREFSEKKRIIKKKNK